MPSSAIESVPHLVEFIRRYKPNLNSVLDIGIGFGKDAFLLHEYFDAKEQHLYQPKEWKVKITGVEIYPPYLSDLQKLLYNEIIIGDIFEVLPTLGKFNLAILSDVLEHFSKEKGFSLLENLFDHVEDIVIATPMGFKSQPSTNQNPYEEHRSGWELKDFERFTVIDTAVIHRIRKNEEVFVVYLRK